MVVLLFNVVVSDTFNVQLMVVLLFMKLLEFNEPLKITWFNVVVPDTLNDDNTVVLLDVKLY